MTTCHVRGAFWAPAVPCPVGPDLANASVWVEIVPQLPKPSPRLLVAAAVLAVIGFGAGAVFNQGVKRLIALPDDAEKPDFEVVASANPAPPGPRPADGDHPDAPTPAPPPPADVPAPHVPDEASYSDVIVRRNIFDSTAVFHEPTEANGNGQCKADSNLRLLATMVAIPMDYSTALLSEGADRSAKSKPYRMGDQLGTDGRIVSIEQKKVCTDTNTCFCMDQAPSKDAGAQASAAPATDEGVRQLAENKYEVDRSFMDSAMGNLEALATQIRASPHKGPDGEIDGFRLSSVRQGSLFSKLGIKNGDIVHSVNGTPLTSAEGAMSAYGALKNQGSFSFEITRRNQRSTISYDIR